MVVFPRQGPGVAIAGPRGGRHAVLGKVNGGEVRMHHQFKVRYLVDVVPKTVSPFVQALGVIGEVNGEFLSR